jgi:plasmid stabilization system protein ParE
MSDLDEIWLFLARESGSEEIATPAIDRISKAFEMLQRFPHAGRSWETPKYPDMRRHASGDYLIFYRASKGILQILRIAHGSRDTRSVIPGK